MLQNRDLTFAFPNHNHQNQKEKKKHGICDSQTTPGANPHNVLYAVPPSYEVHHLSSPIPAHRRHTGLATTAKVHNVSRFPAGTTRAQALAMLSDHEFFLSCNPHLAKYEHIPPADVAKRSPPPGVPDEIRSQLRPRPSSQQAQAESGSEPGKEPGKENGTEDRTEDEATAPLPACYRVTDIVHAVPAGIWDTNVVSDYEFTDIRDGLFVRIKSPLSIVMDTVWTVRAVDGDGGDGDEGGLELVQDITIRCSRLVIGFVKGQCENGWESIHAKMTARPVGGLRKADTSG